MQTPRDFLKDFSLSAEDEEALDQLHQLVNSHMQLAGNEKNGTAGSREEFQTWYHNTALQASNPSHSSHRGVLDALTKAQSLCTETEKSATSCLETLDGLIEQHNSLVGTVSVLHEKCKKLASQREGLSKVIDLLDTNLAPFKEAEFCAHELSRGNLDVFDDRFSVLLCRLDAGCKFMTQNTQFSQAPYYLSTFRHLQVKALQKVKAHVIGSVTQCSQQVKRDISQQAIDKPFTTQLPPSHVRVLSDAEEAQFLFAHFQAVAPALKILIEELECRQHRKELREILAECHQGYFRARNDLLWDFVFSKVSSLLPAQQKQANANDTDQLVTFLRAGTEYITQICRQESKLCGCFFTLASTTSGVSTNNASAQGGRQNNETDDIVDDLDVVIGGGGTNTAASAARHSLAAHLTQLTMPLMDALRSLVIREPSPLVLCGLLDVLRSQRAAIKAALKQHHHHAPNSSRHSEADNENVPNSLGGANSASGQFDSSAPSPLMRRLSSTSDNVAAGRGHSTQFANSGTVDLVVLGQMVKSLQCDVQERLIYRMQLMLRDDIMGFEPTPQQIDYPAILQTSTSHDGLYPPLTLTLTLLSRLYQCVDLRIFEGLAQDAVNACSSALFGAMEKIKKRQGSKTQTRDSLLFLIKHLLALREHITPLDANFAFVERSIDLKNIRDYLGSLVHSPRSLLNIKQLTYALTGFIGEVRVVETKQDPKKDIERWLKDACEQFINIVAQELAAELLGLLAHMSSLVRSQRELSSVAKLDAAKQIPLDNIAKVLRGVETTLKEKIPQVVQHMALYLPDPSTQAVLLKPVKAQVVEAYASVLSFVQTEFVEDQWKPLALPDTNNIAETFSVLPGR